MHTYYNEFIQVMRKEKVVGKHIRERFLGVALQNGEMPVRLNRGKAFMMGVGKARKSCLLHRNYKS